MKRDTEYQLEILKEMEENEDPFYVASPPTFGMNEERVKKWHHLQLLDDEGLVIKEGSGGYRLTAMGHDALDLHRKGLIKRAIEKSGDVGLTVLIDTAKAILLSSVV